MLRIVFASEYLVSVREAIHLEENQPIREMPYMYTCIRFSKTVDYGARNGMVTVLRLVNTEWWVDAQSPELLCIS
jgi:hypothetical protein